ncbi:MAG TPA: hypothetical protein VF831_06045 [Anaerolineales bacterium]
MADVISVNTASGLLHTGSGQLVGLVLTSNAAALQVTIYDNTSGSGTIIFSAYVSNALPLVLFLADRFAIKFSTGLYLNLAAGIAAVVWSRQL